MFGCSLRYGTVRLNGTLRTKLGGGLLRTLLGGGPPWHTSSRSCTLKTWKGLTPRSVPVLALDVACVVTQYLCDGEFCGCSLFFSFYNICFLQSLQVLYVVATLVVLVMTH